MDMKTNPTNLTTACAEHNSKNYSRVVALYIYRLRFNGI